MDDPDEIYVMANLPLSPYHGELLPPDHVTEFVPFQEGEAHWTNAGAELPYWSQLEALQPPLPELSTPDAPTGEVQMRERNSNGKLKGGAGVA